MARLSLAAATPPALCGGVLASSRVGKTQSRHGPKAAGSNAQPGTSEPSIVPYGGGPDRPADDIFALGAHGQRPTGPSLWSASQSSCGRGAGGWSASRPHPKPPLTRNGGRPPPPPWPSHLQPRFRPLRCGTQKSAILLSLVTISETTSIIALAHCWPTGHWWVGRVVIGRKIGCTSCSALSAAEPLFWGQTDTPLLLLPPERAGQLVALPVSPYHSLSIRLPWTSSLLFWAAGAARR